jgi:hypothetical protein
MKIITLPIADIIIGERRREDFGDIDGLAASTLSTLTFHSLNF